MDEITLNSANILESDKNKTRIKETVTEIIICDSPPVNCSISTSLNTSESANNTLQFSNTSTLMTSNNDLNNKKSTPLLTTKKISTPTTSIKPLILPATGNEFNFLAAKPQNNTVIVSNPTAFNTSTCIQSLPMNITTLQPQQFAYTNNRYSMLPMSYGPNMGQTVQFMPVINTHPSNNLSQTTSLVSASPTSVASCVNPNMGQNTSTIITAGCHSQNNQLNPSRVQSVPVFMTSLFGTPNSMAIFPQNHQFIHNQSASIHQTPTNINTPNPIVQLQPTNQIHQTHLHSTNHNNYQYDPTNEVSSNVTYVAPSTLVGPVQPTVDTQLQQATIQEQLHNTNHNNSNIAATTTCTTTTTTNMKQRREFIRTKIYRMTTTTKSSTPPSQDSTGVEHHSNNDDNNNANDNSNNNTELQVSSNGSTHNNCTNTNGNNTVTNSISYNNNGLRSVNVTDVISSTTTTVQQTTVVEDKEIIHETREEQQELIEHHHIQEPPTSVKALTLNHSDLPIPQIQLSPLCISQSNEASIYQHRAALPSPEILNTTPVPTSTFTTNLNPSSFTDASSSLNTYQHSPLTETDPICSNIAEVSDKAEEQSDKDPSVSSSTSVTRNESRAHTASVSRPSCLETKASAVTNDPTPRSNDTIVSSPHDFTSRKKKTAIVRPEQRKILVHYIDDLIVFESDEPFPTTNKLQVVKSAMKCGQIKLHSSQSPVSPGRVSILSRSAGNAIAVTTPSTTVMHTDKFILSHQSSPATSPPSSVSIGRPLTKLLSRKRKRQSDANKQVQPLSVEVDHYHQTVATPPLLSQHTTTTTATTTSTTSAAASASCVSINKPNICHSPGADSVDSSLVRPLSRCSATSPYNNKASPLSIPKPSPGSCPPKKFVSPLKPIQSVSSFHSHNNNNNTTTANNTSSQNVIHMSISSSSSLVECIASTQSSSLHAPVIQALPTLTPAPTPENRKPICDWSVSDVTEFVRSTPGCESYTHIFSGNEIDGEALLLLTCQDNNLLLQGHTLNMKIGPALKLCAKIDKRKAYERQHNIT